MPPHLFARLVHSSCVRSHLPGSESRLHLRCRTLKRFEGSLKARRDAMYTQRNCTGPSILIAEIECR